VSSARLARARPTLYPAWADPTGQVGQLRVLTYDYPITGIAFSAVTRGLRASISTGTPSKIAVERNSPDTTATRPDHRSGPHHHDGRSRGRDQPSAGLGEHPQLPPRRACLLGASSIAGWSGSWARSWTSRCASGWSSRSTARARSAGSRTCCSRTPQSASAGSRTGRISCTGTSRTGSRRTTSTDERPAVGDRRGAAGAADGRRPVMHGTEAPGEALRRQARDLIETIAAIELPTAIAFLEFLKQRSPRPSRRMTAARGRSRSRARRDRSDLARMRRACRSRR